MMNILYHDFKVAKTLYRLGISILLQTFAATIFLILQFYFNGTIDFRAPIIIMLLGIPRIAMSLVGYSVAGEKVYKTFESLLSTGISMKELVIGKALLPMLVALSMFAISLLSTSIFANILNAVSGGQDKIIIPTISEIILVIGNGLGIVGITIFLTAILSVVLKVARNGLFIVSLYTFLIAIPYSYIMYFHPELIDKLAVYGFVILFVLNVILYTWLIYKIKVSSIFKYL